MPTPTTYTFTISTQFDLGQLTVQVQGSTILTALDHMDSLGNAVDFVFKDVLSNTDSSTLTALVSSYVYSTPVNAPIPVVTAEEVNDKTLKLATSISTFDATTHLAVCQILVPGTYAGFGYNDPGRFVAGGYAFTDAGKFGDRCTKIEVADMDNILGSGAGAVIKTYHDQDVDPSNAGWYLYPAPQSAYEIEIDPIGGYGKLPAGLYLRVTFQKVSDSPATQVACNIWWGKIE
jgi:hypothetical protein